MSAEPEVIERAFPGHFICAKDCRFIRTTDVGGKWRVSTVGDLHFGGAGLRREVGYKRFYETMVFALDAERCNGCGGPCDGAQLVTDWSEKDFEGYRTEAQAEAGHRRMVQKYVESFAVLAS